MIRLFMVSMLASVRLYRVGEGLDFHEDQIDNTPWEIEVEQA